MEQLHQSFELLTLVLETKRLLESKTSLSCNFIIFNAFILLLQVCSCSVPRIILQSLKILNNQLLILHRNIRDHEAHYPGVLHAELALYVRFFSTKLFGNFITKLHGKGSNWSISNTPLHL